MIHTRLRLTRPLHIFDLETTSLNRQQARICEIGLQTWTAEGLKQEWRSLVNPGIPILNSKTHGITDEQMTKCARCQHLPIEHPTECVVDGQPYLCHEFHVVPRFAELALRLANGFTNCDFGGKNIRYDLAVMWSEMRRAGHRWDYAGALVIDADRLEQLGEPRSLSHLYKKHTGKDLENAHQALADVRATTEVIGAQLEKYRHVLPPDLRSLHELQWSGWLDCEGKFRFNDEGIPFCYFGKHNGTAMRHIPPGYYRWLTENDFQSDVKQLASDALSGKFPIAQPRQLE